MPYFTDLTGLVSVAAATAAFLQLLPWVKRVAKHHLAIVTGAVFIASLIPFGGFPIAAYVRGATGDLSITTMVLLWFALSKPWNGCESRDPKYRFALLLLVAFAALALYPMALGVGAFDPYRLGYGNRWFVTALMFVALAAWYWKYYQCTLCIALATLAWSVGWYESDNIWDYLLDPFVSIYAVAAIMMHFGKLLMRRHAKSAGHGNLAAPEELGKISASDTQQDAAPNQQLTGGIYP